MEVKVPFVFSDLNETLSGMTNSTFLELRDLLRELKLAQKW